MNNIMGGGWLGNTEAEPLLRCLCLEYIKTELFSSRHYNYFSVCSGSSEGKLILRHDSVVIKPSVKQNILKNIYLPDTNLRH